MILHIDISTGKIIKRMDVIMKLAYLYPILKRLGIGKKYGERTENIFLTSFILYSLI